MNPQSQFDRNSQSRYVPDDSKFGGNKRGGNSGRRRGRGRNQGSGRLCTHCGKTNHTIDTCFFKHGFPPGYQQRVSSANAISSNNFPLEQDQNFSQGSYQPITSHSGKQGNNFTQGQYEALLKLLHTEQSQATSHLVAS